MTDKHDDALMAEVVETLLEVKQMFDALYHKPDSPMYAQIDALLAKLQPAPKPDRAEVLWDNLRDVRNDYPAGAAIIRRHLNELRTEIEAERPAVIVPWHVREWILKTQGYLPAFVYDWAKQLIDQGGD